MNFSDLLDEDGQGSRKCDAWLAENIEDREVVHTDRKIAGNFDFYYADYSHSEAITPYTTMSAIDPIWELAKEYFDNRLELTRVNAVSPDDHLYHCRGKAKYGDTIITDSWFSEQLAIAEALFKAYQNES